LEQFKKDTKNIKKTIIFHFNIISTQDIYKKKTKKIK